MSRVYSKGFRSLIAWQEAKRFALKVYAITRSFPSDEKYELAKQLRRAAGSVVANLAEGSAMDTKAHRASFYSRARGSVVEVDCFMDLSFDLHYLSKDVLEDICDHAARLSYLITKLMQAA